jgi:gamma-glutamyltranspeptidase / glutathione hydrolase
LFMPAGKMPVSGQIVRNVDLATTLKKLAEAEAGAAAKGASRAAALQAAHDRFYKGDIAREIAGYLQANGGVMEVADLAAYQPRWETPLHTTYRGYDVYSNGSTSRGGFEVLMQLNLVEAFDLAALGYGNPKAVHLLAEAIKVAKSDIYTYVADPAFTKVPVQGLLSKAFATERRRLIDGAHASAYPAPGTPPGAVSSAQAIAARGPAFPEHYEPDPETTSFSIVDASGNAVAVTPTIGGGMGTGVVVGSTGLLFNNGLRLGSTSPYPDNVNYVRAGQIPVLNNAPVIVLKDGQLVLAIGTPGGETIGQTEFQGIVNVIDFGLSIQEAIEAPRFRLDAEPNFYKPGAKITMAIERRVPAATIKALEGMGHTVRLLPEYTPGVGGMQGILVNLGTKTMTAGADPRRAGYAIGW